MKIQRPKGLVQVFRAKDGSWDYHCNRCTTSGWDHTWDRAFDRAFDHGSGHLDVGFMPPTSWRR